MSRWKPQPCNDCGVNPKAPGRGMRFCSECKENHRSPTDLQVEARKAKAEAERLAAEQGRKWKESDKDQRAAARAYSKKMIAEAPEGKAWCAQCERYLMLNRFAKRPASKAGRAPWCRSCTGNYNHERIVQKYGITIEQYHLLLAFQEDACWICRQRPKNYRLAVDHNHQTGEVRGLLCKRCNRDLLGKAHDDSDMLRRAAEYLDDPPSRKALADD